MDDSTKRKAIEWFDFLKSGFKGTEFESYLDLAIKAIKIFDDNFKIKQVNHIKMIEKDKWIPCTKNSIPPWNEEVIVTVVDDSGDSPYEYTRSAWWLQDNIWISDNDIVFGEVIAWKPLPEPYKPYKKENILYEGCNTRRT